MRSLPALLVLFATTALAQSVYSWTDANGEVHYTDDPASVPANVRARQVIVGEPPASAPVAASAKRDAGVQEKSGVQERSGVQEKSDVGEKSGAEAEIIAALNRKAWKAADAHMYDPAYGPTFVRLAATSDDALVLTAALKAIGALYSPNPEAPATFNGKRFQRLKVSDEVYQLAVEQLDHEDFHVRVQAAQVAGLGVWGTSPREDVLEALATQLSRETDPGVRETLRFALWSCHCGRPQLVEAAVSAVEENDQSAQLTGLSLIGRVGVSQRNFDAPSRERMRRAAEPHVNDGPSLIRAAAVKAWHATTTDPEEAVVAKLVKLASANDVMTRYTAVTLLGEHKTLASVPPLLAALNDRDLAEVKPEGELPGMTMRTVAEAALIALETVSGAALSRGAFDYQPSPHPLQGAALNAEVARARAWASKNARALKLSK